MANNFLPFCPTDTGSNLLTQGEYDADAQRLIGNQPGVARSKLVNKATRQATFITSQFAEYVAAKTSTNLLDDGDTTKLLAQIEAAIMPIAPSFRSYTTAGSVAYNATFNFFIASGSATAGATYTNNSITYTVVSTVASGTLIQLTGNGFPLTAGTLTKVTGTGDATLSYYAVRAPLYLEVIAVGAGGGGSGGGGASSPAGGNGGDTTFGGTLIVAHGGNGGPATYSSIGGAGGAVTLGAGLSGLQLSGGNGQNGNQTTTGTTGVTPNSGSGASSPLGGAGLGGSYTSNGVQAIGGTGSGGGGGGSGNAGGSIFGGNGGGAGGYAAVIIGNPLATYNLVIGARGAGGTGGTTNGGDASDGAVYLRECFQ